MHKRVEEGSTQQAHLEMAARMGHPGAEWAKRQLEEPEFPEELAYLWDWHTELSLARGEGFSGAAALTYTDIEAWTRLMDTHPEPHEVQALLILDAAIRHPGDDADDDE